MNRNIKRIIALIIGLTFSYSQVNTHSALANNENKSNIKMSQNLENILEEYYSTMLNKWEKENKAVTKSYEILPWEFESNKKHLVENTNSNNYGSQVLAWNKDSEITFEIDIEESGLYNIAFDYFIKDDNILDGEAQLKINDKFQYYEARRIIFHNQWESENKDKTLDRYGNELIPKAKKIYKWQKDYAYDASYLYAEPLKFNLQKGKNKINLKNTRGEILLGKVYIENPKHIDNYESYKKSVLQSRQKAEKSIITLEAENIKIKNDSSIRAFSGKNAALTPYDSEKRLLNIIDGKSFYKGGQEVTWSFKVPKDGVYNIAFKYQQDFKYDLPVYRTIEIDGKVPFEELDNYAFHYSTKWKNEVLKNGEGALGIFLTEGEHNLSLKVNLSNMRPLVEDIKEIMKEISDITLQIQKLTGNKVDKYRDWNLIDYIPDIKEKLLAWAERLQAQYEYVNSLNPSKKEIAEVVNLKMAIDGLKGLAKEPNEIPNRLSQLSQGSSSVSQQLGDLLLKISESPISLDKIYVFSEENLPKPNAGFFTSLKEGIKGFFLSFTQQDYSTDKEYKDEIEVWVNRPRQFVEILQKVIDEEFTPKSGIKVKLSLMPDENKLILSNAAKQAPDVALGTSNWLPYELAVRGAVLDLTQFKDFKSVASKFSKGAIIPLTVEDGVYALPETQDFWVTFYRKDILDSLNISLPQTWKEVVNILPELQRLGMNYYSPISLYSGFKPYVVTSPFVYQFGGELYSKDGMSTAIDSEEALNGIKFMTDLFTIYNVPQQVPNFYNHFRYGTLPIGVASFSTYIQLRIAAPEIANSWSLSLFPGIEKSDGTIERWAPGGGQTAIIFKETKKPQESWEFLKWWMSTEIQRDFALQLQTNYGEDYMWNTANIEAFSQLPWPEEHKKVILEQFNWIREASRVPGGYMVEREISDVWNKIVFNGANPRTTMDDAVIRINREIQRKMEEFGYMKDGKIVKPYKVPTIDTIDEWIDKNEK